MTILRFLLNMTRQKGIIELLVGWKEESAVRVRIQLATIRHFRNVSFGEIRFPCNMASDIFSMKSDVLAKTAPAKRHLLMFCRF